MIRLGYTFLHHEAAAKAEVVEEEGYQMFYHWPVIERRNDKDGAVPFECRERNSEAGFDGMSPDGSHVREDGCRGAPDAIVYVEAAASYGEMQIVVLRGSDDVEDFWTKYGVFFAFGID